MPKAFRIFIFGTLVALAGYSFFLYDTSKPLVRYEIAQFDPEFEMTIPTIGIEIINGLPPSLVNSPLPPERTVKNPSLFDIYRNQRLFDEHFLTFVKGWNFRPPLGEKFWIDDLADLPKETNSTRESISTNWATTYNWLSWSESCEITIYHAAGERRPKFAPDATHSVSQEFDRIFEVAKYYNRRILDFYVNAANEIKLHKCGPRSQEFLESWLRKSAEYRIKTKNGRNYGIAWNPSKSLALDIRAFWVMRFVAK